MAFLEVKPENAEERPKNQLVLNHIAVATIIVTIEQKAILEGKVKSCCKSLIKFG